MGLDGGTYITRSDVLRGASWALSTADMSRSSRGGNVQAGTVFKRRRLDPRADRCAPVNPDHLPKPCAALLNVRAASQCIPTSTQHVHATRAAAYSSSCTDMVAPVHDGCTLCTRVSNTTATCSYATNCSNRIHQAEPRHFPTSTCVFTLQGCQMVDLAR